jgi:limonene-1,2-epoxide hydrolase
MAVQTAQEVVLAFLKDWETGFRGAFERWMHPDAVWQNTGLPDQHGKAAIMAWLGKYNEIMQMPYGRAEIVNIAGNGNTVLTERVDHLWGEEGRRHSAKIMGAFEVRDGLIGRYADYFDASQFKPEQFLEGG